ncbi:MAG: LysR family transcriptional regulator [Kiloniellales bacterium]
MDSKTLQCFVEVVRAGGVRAAARILNVTQPALTARLKRLEDEAGFALFRRQGRGLVLTEQGQLFLPRAIAAVDAAREAQRSADRIKEGDEGTLRVGYTAITALTVLSDIVRRFRDDNPRVKLHLVQRTSHALEKALVQSELDLALLHPPVFEEGLTYRVFTTHSYLCAMSHLHPLASEDTVSLSSLKDEDIIMVRRDVGPVIHGKLFESFLSAGFKPKIAFEADNSISLLTLVSAGLGVGFVVEPLSQWRAPSVIYKQVSDGLPSLSFCVCSRLQEVNPLVERFQACIQNPESYGLVTPDPTSVS